MARFPTNGLSISLQTPNAWTGFPGEPRLDAPKTGNMTALKPEDGVNNAGRVMGGQGSLITRIQELEELQLVGDLQLAVDGFNVPPDGGG